jgi:hypothetical protein
MPKITYEPWNPKPEVEQVVASVNGIVTRYQQRGYDLTLRQVYYQIHREGPVPRVVDRRAVQSEERPRSPTKNTVKNYKRLGDYGQQGPPRGHDRLERRSSIARATSMSLGTWESPSAIVDAVAAQFRYDRWATQPSHVEVWYEKDALMGVFERVAKSSACPTSRAEGTRRTPKCGARRSGSRVAPRWQGHRDPALRRSRPERHRHDARHRRPAPAVRRARARSTSGASR